MNSVTINCGEAECLVPVTQCVTVRVASSDAIVSSSLHNKTKTVKKIVKF